MPRSSSQPVEREQREHPRSAVRFPLSLHRVGSDTGIPCESVDVSASGMRLRSSARIPVGRCEIVVSAKADSRLVLSGEIVEEIIDASMGEVTARMVFAPVVPAAYHRFLSLPDANRRTTQSRRVVAGVAGVATVLAVAAGWVTVTSGEDGVEPVLATPSAAMEGTPLSPLDAPPHVPAAPATTPTAPVSVNTATTEAPAAVEPGPAVAPAPQAPATAVHRTEGADNRVRVVLGSSSEETSVASTVGPSEGVDQVRVQLNITPEPEGTSLPVQVTVENRGDETLMFSDHLAAIVTATRAGAAVATVTLRSADVTEVAPGEVVTIEGVLDFGAPGEYDVIVEVDVVG